MRTIILQHRGRPRALAPAALTAETPRIGLLGVCGLAIAVAVLALNGRAFGARDLSEPGITLWAWVFAASGGVRILAFWRAGRFPGGAALRLAGAAIGLLSWSQVSWLVLQGLAANAGVAAGCLWVYAVVALRELHTIYKAAQDARFDHA